MITGALMDSLILEQDKGVTLALYADITVNDYFESLHCSGFNTLQAGTGVRTVSMGNGGTVNVNHLNIVNVAIDGTDIPYSAVNSTNINNSAGWDIFSGGKDLYWVGGAGNWSDVNHWASESGGAPGSGCIPSAADNVFFDEKSGLDNASRVYIDVPAYCKDMTWHNMDGFEQKPLLFVSNDKQEAKELNIYGSLEWQQGMTVYFPSYYQSVIYFRASDAVTIKNNGVNIRDVYYYDEKSTATSFSSFQFNGTGTWTILDDFNCPDKRVNFVSGNIVMDGITFTAKAFLSSGNAQRSLDIRNSTLNIRLYWQYIGSNATLLADSSHISMTDTPSDNGSLNKVEGLSTHTYDTLTFVKKGTLNDGFTLNTLILAQGFDGSNAIFAFPADGTVTINRSFLPGGTPCDLVNIVSSGAGTKANINVPESEYNIDAIPVGFDLSFVRIRDLHVVEGEDKAKVRLTSQGYEEPVGSNTGGWIIEEWLGRAGLTLGEDTTMWCNATFPIYTDHFYGDHNTTYEWTIPGDDKVISTDDHLIITDFGTYRVKVNYSSTCNATDEIHVDRTNDIHLSGTASPAGGQVKISLSVSGKSTIDPNPVFVLDSVQPAGAISGLPLAQYSPDFYFSTPVKAFFSHTDSLSGCFDTWEMATPVMAVSDTALSINSSVIDVPLLRNDFTYSEGCNNISTDLLPDFTVQHGTIKLLDDTVRYTPNDGWEGIDSVYYILDVCGEKDTAAVYFITVQNTFDACPDVLISMSLPNIPDMTYVWHDPYGNIVEPSSNTHTVTKNSLDDFGEWKIAAVWDGYAFPLFSVYLVNSPTATAAHITGVSGDTLIVENSNTTLRLIASTEVINPVFEWYTDAVGGSKFNTGDVYTTSVLSVDTTFYVAVSGDNLCEGVELKPITVHVIPRPDAVDDFYAIPVNTEIDCDVLANDNMSPICTDPQIKIIDHLKGGSVSVSDGKIVYKPADGFTGKDVISYSFECGTAKSDTAELVIVVVKPLAQQYIACPGAVVTLGFEDISSDGVSFDWYNAPSGGSNIQSSSNTYVATKDNSGATQSYWAEPVSGGIHFERFKVDLEQSPYCSLTTPIGCAADGTMIYKEDFGGNEVSDLRVSSIPAEPGLIDINFCPTGSGSCGAAYGYSFEKYSTDPTFQVQANSGDDHTYPNDKTRGYYMYIDPAPSQSDFKLYGSKIKGLCTGMNLSFTLWAADFHTAGGSGCANPKIEMTIRDAKTNDVIVTTGTFTLPRDNVYTWRQYGFDFVLPVGVDSILFTIVNKENNNICNDWNLDDIEIRLCAPKVNIDRPLKTDTTVCVGNEFIFEGNYDDTADGGNFFGNDLVSRWERNVSGNANNPADWIPIAGTEEYSNTGIISNTYTIDPVEMSDSALYRMVVANTANITRYNCRAMSDIIRLRTSYCLTSVTIGNSDTICYNTVPDEQKLLTKLPTGGSFTYQWMKSEDDGLTWENVPENGTAKDYAPPALKHTTMYRLTVSIDALTVYSNVDTVHVLPASLFNYPDIRIRACANAGTINLSKYLDTFDIKSVVWTTSYGVITNEINTYQLTAPGTYTYIYSVTNSCVSDMKRKVYLNMLNDKFSLPKDTVVVCYEHAEAMQINQLFGIEAGGSLTYFSYSPNDIDAYVTVSPPSSDFDGAVIMNGKALYESSIPAYNYHGIATKKAVFTYTSAANCQNGKTYTIVIILTPDLLK
jgi:hypothetical protein